MAAFGTADADLPMISGNTYLLFTAWTAENLISASLLQMEAPAFYGNGVEYPIIDGLSPSHLFLEAKSKKRGSDSFKQEGSQHDLFCQPDNSSNLQNVYAITVRLLLLLKHLLHPCMSLD